MRSSAPRVLPSARMRHALLRKRSSWAARGRWWRCARHAGRRRFARREARPKEVRASRRESVPQRRRAKGSAGVGASHSAAYAGKAAVVVRQAPVRR